MRTNPVASDVRARARAGSSRASTEEPSSATLDSTGVAVSLPRSTAAKILAVRMRFSVAARLATGSSAARTELG